MQHQINRSNVNKSQVPTLVVVTKVQKPYVILREGQTGNDAYDGFAIDLLKVSEDFLSCLLCKTF